jgi:hypothetical protein
MHVGRKRQWHLLHEMLLLPKVLDSPVQPGRMHALTARMQAWCVGYTPAENVRRKRPQETSAETSLGGLG